jgi:glycosyltransferase involved in cell wall biosynthesis
MPELYYLHSRRLNFAHVAAIKELFIDHITLTQPVKILSVLLKRSAVLVVGANDDLRTNLMLTVLLLFGRSPTVLHFSSMKTCRYHSWLIGAMTKSRPIAIASVSAEVRNAWSYCFPSIKCKVVYHYSEVLDLDLKKTDFRSWKRRQFDAIFFGRLEDVRGIREFLQLCEMLPGMTFAIAGEGSLSDSVKKACERMNNVIFRGFMKTSIEKSKFLSSSKVFVSMMKKEENFGISIIEAIHNGCLVSSPKGIGPLEILRVDDMQIRESNDLTVISEHLHTLLNVDENRYLKMLSSADVQGRFSKTQLATRWLNLIENLRSE